MTTTKVRRITPNFDLPKEELYNDELIIESEAQRDRLAHRPKELGIDTKPSLTLQCKLVKSSHKIQ